MKRTALIVAGLALAFATVSGVVGFLRWRAYSQIPPLGAPTIAEVTPPGVALRLVEQRYCDARVSGFWASAPSPPDFEPVIAWFDESFGPIHEEATVRLAESRGATVRVYDDVTVTLSPRFLWVETYDTLSNTCLRDGVDVWAFPDIAAFEDSCDELVVEFWGVQYGAPIPAEPPDRWTVLDLEDGRSVAHHINRPRLLYAHDGEWLRLQSGRGC